MMFFVCANTFSALNTHTWKRWKKKVYPLYKISFHSHEMMGFKIFLMTTFFPIFSASSNAFMSLISGNKQPRLTVKVSVPKREQKELLE